MCLFSRGFGGISGRFRPVSRAGYGFITSRGAGDARASPSTDTRKGARHCQRPRFPSRCEHSTGPACQPGEGAASFSADARKIPAASVLHLPAGARVGSRFALAPPVGLLHLSREGEIFGESVVSAAAGIGKDAGGAF